LTQIHLRHRAIRVKIRRYRPINRLSMSSDAKHPYRSAALWATIIVVVASAGFLPGMLGYAPQPLRPGLLCGAWVVSGFALMPGALPAGLIMVFVLRLAADHMMWILAVPFSWLFYFGLFSLIAFTRRRRPRRQSHDVAPT
jgi:sterol desaturase/sphingolipid hydroxylase (fatty acid hydroxylase superfamily)